MFKNISFRNQLGLIFSIGMLLLALVAGLLMSELTSRRVEQRLVDEGLKLTETFAEQSKLALLYLSDESAEEAASVLMSFPDIRAVEIVDINHRALFANDASTEHETSIRPWPDTLRLMRETADSWEFSSPVFSGGDYESLTPFAAASSDAELIGHVRVIMDKKTLRHMESDIFRYNLLISLGLASILLLALLAVTGRVTKPLQNLAKTMLRAQQGEQSVRAELRGTSDIREMEAAFNTMMNTLDGREAALKTARDEAIDSAKAKGEFAANVSHELRTPMNGVLGMLDILGDSSLDDKQMEFVGVARHSAESLLTLIDDLLDFSKNEAGKATLSEDAFSTGAILEQIVALLSGQAQAKGIDIAYVRGANVPEYMIGDSHRIRQVLVNLVGNALKFTERGSVGVELALVESRDTEVTLRFEVWDNGLGISEEQQGRIFEVFSQADESTTRKFGGTGLGLSISRQLVNLMGGDMGVESELGEGSRFWFTLPMRLDPSVKDDSPEPSLESTDARILIVEGNELVHRSLGGMLDRYGLAWECASDYEQAVNKFRDSLHDLPFTTVLVEAALEGNRGADLMAYVHGVCAKNGHDVNLVVLHPGSKPQEAVRESYAAAYLSKPVLQKHLIECLNRIGFRGKRPSQHSAAVERTGIAFKGCRLLVVEDDRANQQVALAMLERMGCKVDIVNNGLECLEQISRASYDLVLMDCHMPELDGYKATKVIRECESDNFRVPIIAMTANVTDGERNRCLDVGMDDYLAKPLSRDALKEKLECWLGSDQIVEQAVPEPVTQNQVEDNDELEPVLDLQVLASLETQLGAAVDKIVDALVEDLPVYLESLQAALFQGDIKAIADVAHTIKGSTGNIGALRLVEYSRTLEEQARGGDIANARHQVEVICEASQELLAQLAKVDFSQGINTEQSALPVTSGAVQEKEKVYSGEPRILIVDDDRGSRLAMAEVLRTEGYWVDEASDGERALVYCEENAPDLVLMDAVMPNMDGFTACALLQNLSQTRKVPVLIITALNDEASINKAFASGATDYISKPVNFWVLSKRITHLVQAHHAERHVHQLAYNDSLTGLPNRAMFNEHMTEVLARPRKNDSQMALMFLDLDRFKLVNDTLGHETGDLLLKYFSERVQGCLRKDDVVARFGGDEFTILLDRVKSRESVCQVAEKIHEQLSRPFVFMGKEMYVSTSIGVAMFPEHGEDIGTLLKGADMAMYRAKKLGVSYQFYESQMEADVSRRMQLENDLRGALEREEFEIFYQPQEDLKAGSIPSMEALIRWQHPERGLVGPDEFIYLAEETGQILRMGEWVLRGVCEQLQSWREGGYKVMRCSVNLSGKQLTSPDLVNTVTKILQETSLPPKYLELEITESTIMEDPEQVIKTLTQLKTMGLSLAIDDFGTGYSSLNYLKRFPIDVIKIDRSFVADIITNQVDADIVKTIIDLAHVLDVDVVAEGVETELQRAFLKKQGCDVAQGYYLSRPVPIEKIEELFLGPPMKIDQNSGA